MERLDIILSNEQGSKFKELVYSGDKVVLVNPDIESVVIMKLQEDTVDIQVLTGYYTVTEDAKIKGGCFSESKEFSDKRRSTKKKIFKT